MNTQDCILEGVVRLEIHDLQVQCPAVLAADASSMRLKGGEIGKPGCGCLGLLWSVRVSGKHPTSQPLFSESDGKFSLMVALSNEARKVRAQNG